jgi:hypothetical protein
VAERVGGPPRPAAETVVVHRMVEDPRQVARGGERWSERWMMEGPDGER